jgi:predicted nucleotidyltransferase
MNNNKIKTKREIMKILKQREGELTHKFKVKEIGLFGSYIRDEQNKKSDIDILVKFAEQGITFDNYMNLKFYLEELFSVKVDLVTKDSIKKTLKPYILQEVVYV